MGLHRCLVLLALSFLSLLLFSVTRSEAVPATRSEAIPGGWIAIKNVNDQHVEEIAKYAVTEYDKRSGLKLKLVRVVKGETQVVAGTNYRLVLKAKDGHATGNYQAVVWEKPWINFKNLTSFQPL